MKEVFKIKDLGQIRLLSDPLKLQLLQAFAEGAKTTKQVAAELDGGLSRTNFMIALRALRVDHPALINGIAFGEGL